MSSVSTIVAVLLCAGLFAFTVTFIVGLIKDIIKLNKIKKSKKNGGEKEK